MTDRSDNITGGRPVALITGATRRVGLATARAMARSGYDLVITHRGKPEEAEAAGSELRSLGARVRFEVLSLDDLEAVDAAARGLASRLERLDALVHNASSYNQTPLDSLTASDILVAYRVNAAAPLLLSRGLARLLSASPRPGGGTIVAMADIHALGEHGLPRKSGFAAYSMSKAALMEMVRTLARELAPHVRVNAVAPGVVAWPEQGIEANAGAQEAYLKSVPLGRAGTPEDAAEAVRWLAVDAVYLTGEVVRVDGGRNLL